MSTSSIYIQQTPPQLFKIISLKHPQNDLSLQFWDHIVDFIQIQIKRSQQSLTPKSSSQSYRKRKNQFDQIDEENNQRIHSYKRQLLIAKGKLGNVVVWKMIQNCIIFQKTIKIPYGMQKQITFIKLYEFKNTSKSQQKQQNTQKQSTNPIILLLIGYCDGVLQVYSLNQFSQGNFTLTKYLSIKNASSQPIIDIKILNHSTLIVLRPHRIFIYKQLIQQISMKIRINIKYSIKCTQNQLKIKQFKQSSRLSIKLNPLQNILHIYTQLDGLLSYEYPQFKRQRSIVDSIKSLIQTEDEDIVIGSADDTIKIIYKDKNQIQKIVGLKSIPAWIQANTVVIGNGKNNKKDWNKKILELWIADMYGEIHYLTKIKNNNHNNNKNNKNNITNSDSLKILNTEEDSDQNDQLVIYEQQFKKGKRISQNGIKKICLGQNILIVIDGQMNITLYDIIRKFNTNNQETDRQTNQ